MKYAQLDGWSTSPKAEWDPSLLYLQQEGAIRRRMRGSMMPGYSETFTLYGWERVKPGARIVAVRKTIKVSIEVLDEGDEA